LKKTFIIRVGQDWRTGRLFIADSKLKDSDYPDIFEEHNIIQFLLDKCKPFATYEITVTRNSIREV